MIELSSVQILQFIKDGAELSFEKEGKKGSLLSNLDFSEEGIFFDGYEAYLEDEPFFETKDYDEMRAFLEANDLQITAIDGHTSLEKYLAHKAFQEMDMQGLLEKYKDCDSFALCGYYGERYLPDEECERVCEEMSADNYAYLFAQYEKYKEEYDLPPFERLYEDIFQECERYLAKKVKRNKFYSVSMICDEVGRKTKYSEPMELFWHFYHLMGFDFDNVMSVAPLQLCEDKTPPTAILDEPEYIALRPHLLSCTPTFKTHCTTSGSLQKELRFALNEQTKAWLLGHKDDYDFEGELQDLAFYKDGKLRFSSCTHEGFHDDIE